MNLQKLQSYIFDPKREKKMRLILGALLTLLAAGVATFQKKETPSSSQTPTPNLSLMIPQNHVLYPFEASNFEKIEPLLDSYNMVRVHDPVSGELLAKNIRILRAPHDPTSLAFLVPVNIANHFAEFGLQFKLVIQKYNKDSDPIYVKNSTVPKSKRPLITYGEKKDV